MTLSDSAPPLPRNVVYPDVHPSDYPPRPILEAEVGIGSEGIGDMRLKWTLTRPPRRTIDECEVHVYEYTGQPHDPHLWRKYEWEHFIGPSFVYISHFQLNPYGQYFFTVRLMDDRGTLGPFGDPVRVGF